MESKDIGRNPWQEKSLRKRVSLPASAHYFKIRLRNKKKYMKYKSACLHLHKPAVYLKTQCGKLIRKRAEVITMDEENRFGKVT